MDESQNVENLPSNIISICLDPSFTERLFAGLEGQVRLGHGETQREKEGHRADCRRQHSGPAVEGDEVTSMDHRGIQSGTRDEKEPFI